MSGRAVRQKGRAVACWHDPADRDTSRRLVTADLREKMRQLALDDPEEFVRQLSECRVASLQELPWWPEFRLSYAWEAATLTLMAGDAGIGTR